MPLFQKKEAPIPYDPALLAPAVRRSICTGEMTLGFVDKRTGKFRDYLLARSQKELEAFCRRTGVTPSELRTIY